MAAPFPLKMIEQVVCMLGHPWPRKVGSRAKTQVAVTSSTQIPLASRRYGQLAQDGLLLTQSVLGPS
jgi:hypothetical protein